MVGRQISSLRQSKGWSRQELARRIRVDPSTVAYWERNEATPRQGALRRLARQFEVTVADLFSTKKAA